VCVCVCRAHGLACTDMRTKCTRASSMRTLYSPDSPISPMPPANRAGVAGVATREDAASPAAASLPPAVPDGLPTTGNTGSGGVGAIVTGSQFMYGLCHRLASGPSGPSHCAPILASSGGVLHYKAGTACSSLSAGHWSLVIITHWEISLNILGLSPSQFLSCPNFSSTHTTGVAEATITQLLRCRCPGGAPTSGHPGRCRLGKEGTKGRRQQQASSVRRGKDGGGKLPQPAIGPLTRACRGTGAQEGRGWGELSCAQAEGCAQAACPVCCGERDGGGATPGGRWRACTHVLCPRGARAPCLLQLVNGLVKVLEAGHDEEVARGLSRLRLRRLRLHLNLHRLRAWLHLGLMLRFRCAVGHTAAGAGAGGAGAATAAGDARAALHSYCRVWAAAGAAGALAVGG